MHTQKVAITMPDFIIKEIDTLSKKRGISRSRYITLAVREKMNCDKKTFITECYNRIFSDTEVQKEQIETALGFEETGSESGQEW